MTSATDEKKLPLPADLAQEPIPGYEVVERVGVGGYGEVWKANAPGGLAKALKFVYGHLDDDRAQSELKALNRIKEVRHPFLLSIERIEVVDGHLVIVTELAEATLKDLFDECQRAGMPGIPRERLLDYLRDAADALDYICEEHGLQHLDVKPENLLLVGGRVKVADFGLVKELVDAKASMMGGLTPIYASPEVFDGRPNRNSDQYSLAILFQEMLTGDTPFSGRTAAQLAAQHLHSRPRLDPLPPADRPIVARGLSKDPQKRFSGCRALVDALLDAGKAAPSNPQSAAPQHRTMGTAPQKVASTICLDDLQLTATLSTTQAIGGFERPSADDIETLPPLELTGQQARYRPTLFLGIGGTAALALYGLRRRLHDRFGNLDEVPSLQMLLIDTDRDTLARVSQKDDDGALRLQETMALPLRRTQEYREDASRFLNWLSRRWLYNIPRSLKTEGMRPLGRLALADHSTQLADRLRNAIETATDAAAIAQSSEKTALPFETEGLRVFVVASISGGTGSGMALDVAYLVRQIMAEHGLRDDNVHGMLLHSTDRTAKGRDLAIANSLACLVEWNHFSQPASHYPGDESLGVASYTGRTFTHPYIVHLGDDLSEDELAAGADRVADFLYRNSATGAAEFFDHSREPQADENPENALRSRFRTFGLCQLGLSHGDIPASMGKLLCRKLIDEWRGENSDAAHRGPTRFAEQHAPVGMDESEVDSADREVDELAAQEAERLQLQADHLAREIQTGAQNEMAQEPDVFFTQFLKQYMEKQQLTLGAAYQGATVMELLKAIDYMMGTATQDDYPDTSFVSLQSAISAHLDEMANRRAVELRQWMHNLVDNSRSRLRGVQRGAEWFKTHFTQLATKSRAGNQDAARRAAQLAQELVLEKELVFATAKPTGPADKLGELNVDPRIAAYFRTRLEEVVRHGVSKVARLISDVHITAILDDVRDLLRQLGHLVEHYPDTEAILPHDEDDDSPLVELLQRVRSTVEATLRRRMPELTVQLESEMFGEAGGLRQMLIDYVDINRELPARLLGTARRIVQQALRRINIADIILTSSAEVDPSGDDSPLRYCLETAVPTLTWCGRSKRLVAIVPDGEDRAGSQSEFEDYLCEPLNIVYDSDVDLVLCYEVQGLTLEKVAAGFIEGRPDLCQVASRLHTRVDVDWISLKPSHLDAS